MKLSNPIILLSLITFLLSCESPDPKAALEKLKVQKAELETQIRDLEAELNKTGNDTLEDNLRTVLVSVLKPELFKKYVEVQGQVDADENVSLSFGYGGQITKIHVKVGQEVSKGQLLVEVDQSLILKGMEEVQTALELATSLYEKQKNLWDQKIGTEVQYLAAKSQKESLEKKMATLKEQQTNSMIVAPISGTIDGVHTKVGQMMGPGMPVVTVVNFTTMKVKAQVPESYANNVKTGNDVMVLFPDMKDSVTGKINYAARVINALNRTFQVEMVLDGKKEYHPNMIAVMKINDYTSSAPVIVIPSRVIMRGEDGKDYVMIIEQNKAKKIFVKTANKYHGRIEITQGLKEGDQLVTLGYTELNDGDLVKTTSDQPAQ